MRINWFVQVAALTLLAGSLCGEPPAPVPAPTVAVPAPLVPPRQWEATILGPGGRSLELASGGDFFGGVLLAVTDQSVTITLRVPIAVVAALDSEGLRVACVDGGRLASGSAAGNVLSFPSVAADGAAVFAFEPPARPGFYRVWARAGKKEQVLSFRVPEAKPLRPPVETPLAAAVATPGN